MRNRFFKGFILVCAGICVVGCRHDATVPAKDEGPRAAVATVQDVASSKRLPDNVGAWAKAWVAAEPQSRPSDNNTLGTLSKALAASDLSVDELLDVGQSLFEAQDEQAAGHWFAVGIDRAKSELDSAMTGATTDAQKLAVARRVLLPIITKLERGGDEVWYAWNAPAELKLSEMELLLPRADDNDIRPENARLRRASAVGVLGNHDQSLKELNAMLAELGTPAGVHFNDYHKAVMHWEKGVNYQMLGNVEGQIEAFREVVKFPQFDRTPISWQFLVSALCKLNRGIEAEQQYNAYLQFSHQQPSPRFVAMIERAKVVEQQAKSDTAKSP